MKRIYEQEEIYNAIMAVIDEQDRTIAEMDKAIEKKDNEIRKLKEILMAAGMSPEAIELRLST